MTHPTTAGHITAFPSGRTRPDVSSLSYAKGWTGANLVTVAVGANGKVDLYNSAGSVDLIADVVGWYAASRRSTRPSARCRLPALDPRRVLDSGTSTAVTSPWPRTRTDKSPFPTPSDFVGHQGPRGRITLTAVSDGRNRLPVAPAPWAPT